MPFVFLRGVGVVGGGWVAGEGEGGFVYLCCWVGCL